MDLKLPDFSRRHALGPVLPSLAQVRCYWEGLRTDGGIPQRSRLDPRGLDGLLDRVFLAEGVGRGLAQVRIAGSSLSALAGMDLRGLPLSCLFSAESRLILADVLDRILAGHSLAELDLGLDRGQRGVRVARLLLLPLADPEGRQLVLGAFTWPPASAPHTKLQVLARHEEQLYLPKPTEPAPEPAPIRQRGHLALVHSA